MRSAVSSGTLKFAVDANNDELAIMSTAIRRPEAVANDGIGDL
jgi:hypothetical protein